MNKIIKAACEKYDAQFIPAGWMGLILPWFYMPFNPRETDEQKKVRKQDFANALAGE